MRSRIFAVLTLLCFGTYLIFYTAHSYYRHYPETTCGQREAMEVAVAFTKALSAEDYETAHSLLSPVAQRLMNDARSFGANCLECRPVSGTWEAYDHDERDVTGTAVLADGKELPVEVHAIWLRGEFRISGAEFGTQDDHRMSFLACCDDRGAFDFVEFYKERFVLW